MKKRLNPLYPWPIFYVNMTNVCLPGWVIVAVAVAFAVVFGASWGTIVTPLG